MDSKKKQIKELKITGFMKQKAEKNGVSMPTFLNRLETGTIPELLYTPVEIIDPDSEVATDSEAWGELTSDQLEVMREFDQLSRIAKY